MNVARRVRQLAVAGGAALLMTGCLSIQPVTGSGPVEWRSVFAPAPPDVPPYDFRVVANPNVRAWDCSGTSEFDPMIENGIRFDDDCNTHYEGEGIVVGVPEECQDTVTFPDPGQLPPDPLDAMNVTVRDPADGSTLLTTSVSPGRWTPGFQGYRLVRSGVVLTYAGDGTLTSGHQSSPPDAVPVTDVRVEQTPRLPVRGRYQVFLTCTSSYPEGAPAVRVTNESTVTVP